MVICTYACAANKNQPRVEPEPAAAPVTSVTSVMPENSATEPVNPETRAAVVMRDNVTALPPSTASYEEALALPETLNANDVRSHLSDLQLTGPMRDVLAGCMVPKGAKVSMKVAVQNGRAVGVTVIVKLDRPKVVAKPHPKRSPKAEAKAAKAMEKAARNEAKMVEKLTDCAGHAIRSRSWPPSSRRDSFTSEY